MFASSIGAAARRAEPAARQNRFALDWCAPGHNYHLSHPSILYIPDGGQNDDDGAAQGKKCMATSEVV